MRSHQSRPNPRLLLGVGAPVAAAALVLTLSPAAAPARTPAASTAQTREQRIDAAVNGLVQRMTLAEKFGQLTMSGPTGVNGTPGATLLRQVRQGEVGSVLYLSGAANLNQLQHAALQSRLHIPIIDGLDVIHGYQTIFPVPIAEASSFDPAAVQRDGVISAAEATAEGVKWAFNPMVDVSRDPRWGRVVQGAGEDPYLGSVMAAAKVHGYQGADSDYSARDRMAATIKHFAGYGAPQAGREYNTVDMSQQQLRNIYLPPYKAGIDAGAATVMTAFNSLNGVPATGDPFLFRTILRQEWGFDGAVISDYQAVQELTTFGYAANGEDAARLALRAGVDIEMAVQVPSEYSTFLTYGPALVRSGKVSMAQVDGAVRHVLRLKYLAGLFDHPYTDPSLAAKTELTPAHLAAARSMAAHSMVLLRNSGGALPLSRSVRSVAVVGPLADNATDILGPDLPVAITGHPVTVLAGIRRAVPHATVRYAAGCDTTCTSTVDFGKAVAAAKASDVTVLAVGEPAAYSGEASSRSHLDLPGRQQDLVNAVAATGKPYVVVLMNGRPLTIPNLATTAPALLEAWFPGIEGGNAVADVLFGAVNPGGKLPMSFPRDVGQIPISYNELPTGRPADPANKYTSEYLDVPNTPQFPFGFGLSYTNFRLSGLHLSAASIPANGRLTVSATIRNTGAVAGDDVVQLYIHDKVASIVQPVRRLRGFQRVTLAAGQSRRVTFTLGRDDVGFWDNAGRYVVEPGAFDVWVGDSSTGGLPGTFAVK